MSVRRLVFAGAVAVAVSACASGIPAGTHVTVCTDNAAREDAITILSTDHYAVGGWSHVNGVGSFESVAHPVAAYRITAERYTPDASCGDARTWSVVLAKKTGNWDRNHANGIEASMPRRDITFAQVQDLTMVVKVSSDGTVLPSTDDLQAAYGQWLTPEQVESLDSSVAAIELIVFGDSTQAPYVNASVLVEFPEELMDQWVRVHIPRDQWTFYSEINYERTEVDGADYPDHRVAGLRINPETTSMQVARHFIGDAFDPVAVPELFKEMAFTFALIEVGADQPATE